MGFLKRVFAQRVEGDKPSPPVAAGAAAVAGGTAAVIVYRLLRSG
jgi:hypothetical protein